jgi:hypothetical protein
MEAPPHQHLKIVDAAKLLYPHFYGNLSQQIYQQPRWLAGADYAPHLLLKLYNYSG